MFPPKGSGLERIKENLEKISASDLSKRIHLPEINSIGLPGNLPDPVKSIQNFVRNFSENIGTTLSQIIGKEPDEDYNTIVKGFIPADSELIIPDYPAGSKAILSADLDNDGRKELVFSCRQPYDSISTVILAKNDSQWVKTAEISSPGYKSLHYRKADDLAGNGTVQLLLGMAAVDGSKDLQGYSCSKEGVTKLFGRNYHKLELLGRSKTDSKKIALWQKDDEETWNIEMHRWNGRELEIADKQNYYDKMVLPQYIMELKHTPNKPLGWYVLADSLAKAGYRKDALDVLNYGLKHNRGTEYQEKFMRMMDRLEQQN